MELIVLKKHRKNEIRNHGQIVPTLTESHQHIGGANPPLIAFIPTSGTNTPTQYIKNTMENAMQQTLLKSEPKTSQTTIYSVVDSLVNHLVSLEKGEDLRTPEALSFLKSLGLHETKDPDIYSLKTLRVSLVTTREKLSRQCLGYSPTWGIELNGRYLIASTLEFPKTGKGCSLSDTRETLDNLRFFL